MALGVGAEQVGTMHRPPSCTVPGGATIERGYRAA